MIVQWTPGGTSSDIEDRRGESGGGGFGGFGFGGGGFGRGVPMSLGGILLMVVISFLYNNSGSSPETAAPSRSNGSADRVAGEDRQVQFMHFVLDDIQNTWQRTLQGYR